MTKARDLADLGNGVTEADIAASNSATNGYMLTAQSGNTGGLTWAEAPSSFAPVAVTGATPSLDVGSYNYFDNGTLNANTTVSFASVPTNAEWTYTASIGIASGAWDITTISNVRFRYIGAEQNIPTGLFFKPDGKKMYLLGFTEVDEYNLDTPWDATSAIHVQSTSVSSQDTQPQDIFFKPDGTKMFILGQNGLDVNEYALSTAWDSSTISATSVFSVSSQDSNPRGLSFKTDGTKMYVVGTAGQDINEYNLSSAWDITSASFLQNFSVASQEASPNAMFFKPDGTKMYVIGATGDDINEYNLSSAWDVSSASFLQVSGSIGSYAPSAEALFLHPEGGYVYFAGSNKKQVVQCQLGTAATVTLPASVENPVATAQTFNTTITYNFITTDGGTTVNLIDNTPQSTAEAAIGTYTWGRPANDLTYDFGSVATAVYPVGENSSSSNARWISGTWTNAYVGTVLPGTWRCVSGAQGNGGYGFLGLWVRIL